MEKNQSAMFLIFILLKFRTQHTLLRPIAKTIKKEEFHFFLNGLFLLCCLKTSTIIF